MDDVRPHRTEEKDRRTIDIDNQVDWEMAIVDLEEELSFDIPRD